MAKGNKPPEGSNVIRFATMGVDTTLKRPGGSGDGGGGMEQRISAIEKRLDGIDGKLASLSTDSAYLKGRIEDMPTKDWMNGKLFQLFAALGVMLAVFTAVAKLI